MKLRDFKIGWRMLLQEPAYSAVAILGLSIGFAACILLLGFVRYSLSYDGTVPDIRQVYLVKQRYNVDPVAPWFEQAPYVLRAAGLKTPGVASVSGYAPREPFPVRVGARMLKLHRVPVLPGFAQMLGLQAVEGDLQAALERPENFAITEQAALRLFGSAHALGRSLTVDGKLLKVAAILRNPPANSTMPFEALMGVNSVLLSEDTRKDMLNGSGYAWGKLLIRVQPGASLSAITQALQQALDRSPAPPYVTPEIRQRLGQRKLMDIKLSPLQDAYFDREIADNPIARPGERGDAAMVGGLGAIAVLILALAAMNYVNLSTVRVLRRQREIAMRKVLGAGVGRIVLQFLAESLLVALLATGLGLLLAWLALPLFSDLMNRRLDSLFSLVNLAAALLIGIALGLLCAAYPAWIAIHVRPGQVLAGRPDSETLRGRRLRRSMTVLQVAAAMGLASITLAIAWQTSFAMHASPGFDPAPLLIVDLPEQVKNSEKARALIAALLSQRKVAGVAVAADAVGRYKSPWGLDVKREGGASVFVEMASVSANFFELYGIKALAGRLFDARIDQEDDALPIVLNGVAVRKLGYASPEAALGQTLLYTDFEGKTRNKRIVGIAPELRFHTLHEAPRATAWELWTQGGTLSVRATAPLAEVERTLLALWPSYFPDALPEIHRAADILAANYEEDARIAQLLAIATGIALALAAFGTYVLSAYSVQKRAREIVLRKLYGANRSAIARLLGMEFGGLLGLAALLALPLAAWAIERYLAGFVGRAPVGAWTLLAALVLAGSVAALATLRHILAALRIAPAQALRN
ncbi:MAG: ABC transporter permease [Burkholderiales bacterium]|nr:ABC transporter permease [Burkholderiales bacterium]